MKSFVVGGVWHDAVSAAGGLWHDAVEGNITGSQGERIFMDHVTQADKIDILALSQ